MIERGGRRHHGRHTARAARVSIVSAPGESRESVEVARGVLEAAARGVPFDRIAVAVRAVENYRAVLEEAVGELPAWARPLGFDDYFGIRHRRFRDQLEAMMADAEERVAVNRRAGELTVSFGGDTNQAGQFARSVPDFVLKGRFADVVRLDLHALEQEMGFAVGQRAGWWQRIMRR